MANIKIILKWVFVVGFSGILVPVVQKLFGLIPWDSFLDMENWNWLIVPKFSLLSVTIFLLLFITIIPLSKKILRTTITKNKEKELKKINHSIDEERGVKVTWDVGIGSLYNTNPFAYNIQFFCTKHGAIPIRMMYGHCTDPQCPNAREHYNEHAIKNHIESLLLHARDNMNG